jgi:Poly A polymerase head domain
VDERIRTAVGEGPAWIVGGALRDELLGREVVDVDVICAEPQTAARSYAAFAGGAVFPLSETHGAWRVAFRSGRTVDFTPLQGGSIEADLASRDFTINALARRLEGSDLLDPFGGCADLSARRLRAVSETVFADDPLRLLRAVRLEHELGFTLDAETERLARAHVALAAQPAGERILGELERMPVRAFERLDELGLLGELGGRNDDLAGASGVDTPEFRLVWFFREELERYPISNELRRYARKLLAARCPPDATPRAVHRFRRATEPWALDAVAFQGCGEEVRQAVERAREADPGKPLLRGDELGVPPGREVGRLLGLVAEERAAGTISTREEALALVERERRGGSTTGI